MWIMGRAIGGMVLGYVVMAAIIFVAFTAAYAAMGADGAFKPGTTRSRRYGWSSAWS
jgi:hypothetical protein